MYRKILKYFNPHFGQVHYGIIIAVCTLCLYGCLMVFSASLPISALNHRVHFHPFHFIIRHGMALLLGIGCAFLAYHTPLDFWAKKARILLTSAVLLLILTLLVGREINGAKRWIPLGFINFQAAEYLKLIIIFYTADFCVRKLKDIRRLGVVLLPIVLVVLSLCGLLLLQPDLGSLIVVAIEILGLVFLAGFPLKVFFSLFVLFGTGIYTVIALTPWRVKRILAFLDPWHVDYVQGTGYQLANSLIAFGRGEWFGVGIGNSIQKMGYLPEPQTDFIFAICAEETGLFGGILLLLVFLYLFWQIFEIAHHALLAQQLFNSMVAQGIGIWFAFQMMVNIGVTTGLLPTKGLTLPFISYGGSALIFLLTAVGIILRIHYEVEKNRGK